MSAVTVLIFHAPAPRGAGPRETLLAESRARMAEVHRRRFLATHAPEARIISDTGPPVPFGPRLERALDALPARRRQGGVVVLGSGSLPLATAADRAEFVTAAAGGREGALTNNRYSGDIVAIPAAGTLPRPIAVASDNALPRWLEEVAGRTVEDRPDRWRLQVDLDTPLDLFLAARDTNLPAELRELAQADLARPALAVLRRALVDVSAVMDDRRRELVVFGRTSARTLRWLEANTRCRVRALVEERGMRSASGGRTEQRSPRSLLGRLLEFEGPAALARQLAELGDAAILDTRVLLADRFGSDERRWPGPEDRFASDLLEPGAVLDPWLRALTEAAATGGQPILLGGHSLVGPGVRLLRTGRRRDPLRAA